MAALTDNARMSWQSVNTAVATVDSNGYVTALAEGITEIIAENADFSESIHIKVVEEGDAEHMRLSINLKAKESQRLYLNDDFTNILWFSMDNAIVTVDEVGRVTAVSDGLVLITAEYEGMPHVVYVRVSQQGA